MNFFKSFLISIFFIFPSFCFSQIIFSEIMFDADGTDAGYEWVEIKNTKSYGLDFEGYKFCEGTSTISCRSFSESENPDFEIGANSFAIITDDREKFLEKNSFEGLVLQASSFTLNNTGETIQIKNTEGNLEDSLKYNPESGGKDGNTLSVFENVWKNSSPTPGLENIEKIISSSSSAQTNIKINTSYIETSSDQYLGKKKIKAEIDEIGVLVAGAKAKISGRAYGLSGIEISGVDFFWNFGDGKKDYGSEVFHEFSFAGEYVVSLTVRSGNFTGSDKIKIKVLNPSLEISDVKQTQRDVRGYIKLKNNSNDILNIGGWIIFVDGEEFEIPEDTFIDKNSEIFFPNRTTDLWPQNNSLKKSNIFLKFPNGQKIFSYSFDKKEVSLKAVTEEKKAEKIPEPKVIYIEKKVEVEKKEMENKDILEKKRGENFINLDNYFVQKYETRTKKDYIEENIYFVSFLFFLAFLILSVLYFRKKEKDFQQEDFEESEEQKYESEIEAEAESYQIEEILDK